jgi:hypothetical protein
MQQSRIAIQVERLRALGYRVVGLDATKLKADYTWVVGVDCRRE